MLTNRWGPAKRPIAVDDLHALIIDVVGVDASQKETGLAARRDVQSARAWGQRQSGGLVGASRAESGISIARKPKGKWDARSVRLGGWTATYLGRGRSSGGA